MTIIFNNIWKYSPISIFVTSDYIVGSDVFLLVSCSSVDHQNVSLSNPKVK